MGTWQSIRCGSVYLSSKIPRLISNRLNSTDSSVATRNLPAHRLYIIIIIMKLVTIWQVTELFRLKLSGIFYVIFLDFFLQLVCSPTSYLIWGVLLSVIINEVNPFLIAKCLRILKQISIHLKCFGSVLDFLCIFWFHGLNPAAVILDLSFVLQHSSFAHLYDSWEKESIIEFYTYIQVKVIRPKMFKNIKRNLNLCIFHFLCDITY